MPLYFQIAESLREWIQGLNPSPSDQPIALPSGAQLCSIYGVNPGTVHHALRLLEQEGLVARARGRGTYVRRRRVELDIGRLCSTTEYMRARGWVPGVRVLGVERVAPREHVQRLLEISEDQEVWEVCRLRLADNEPISVQWSYIPCALVPDLGEQDLSTSLYNTLMDVYSIEVTTADQTVRVRKASTREASLLEIEDSEPVLVFDGTYYDRRGRRIEYEHGIWRGDRYDLRVHQSRAS